VTHRFANGAVTGSAAVVMNADLAVGWNTVLCAFPWQDIRVAVQPGTPPGSDAVLAN
jgi:hypothetical protein